MFFFECEKGYVPDNGQNDVTNGSVENYDFDWNEEEVSPQMMSAPTLSEQRAETSASE